jgi:hypothetical protein
VDGQQGHGPKGVPALQVVSVDGTDEAKGGDEVKGDKSREQLAELRAIQRRNKGVLHPADVVAFARDESTALHSAFEWNDDEAAHQYRLDQARRLIRVAVEVIDRGGEAVRVSAFVALSSERYSAGGYRHMPTMMQSEEGRASVLETALWELDAFRAKYKEVKELAVVFAAVDNVRQNKKERQA